MKNNQGFSLVELIIVIAIMAILVGVVGTQVIPYIEKSRQAKDIQIMNGLCTATISAFTGNATLIEATDNYALVYTNSGLVDDTSVAGCASTPSRIIDDIIERTEYHNFGEIKADLESRAAKDITGFRLTYSSSRAVVEVEALAPAGSKAKTVFPKMSTK